MTRAFPFDHYRLPLTSRRLYPEEADAKVQRTEAMSTVSHVRAWPGSVPA